MISQGRTLRVQEGQFFTVPMERPQSVREAFAQATSQLNLRFGGLSEPAPGRFRVDNVIGTIKVGRTELEICPKCEAGADWIGSVIALLGTERVSLAGDRAGDAGRRMTLLDAIARAYADRLDAVFRNEGPITLIERRAVSSNLLNGRFNVAEWARKAAWQPHIFPIEHQELSFRNEYNSTMAYVADLLAHATRLPLLRGRLLDVAAQLTPGMQAPVSVAAGIEERMLPDQWASYAPAWSLARMVLQRRLPLAVRRTSEGMSLAIEPWPLLERLLERSLEALVAGERKLRPTLYTSRQTHVRFIDPLGGTHSPQILKPDSVLSENGVILANFEAKYRDFGSKNRPLREESYQAISAARALRSPLAVLVYPGQLAPRWWKVLETGPYPARLAVVGLDMFSYRGGTGDRERADLLLSMLKHDEGVLRSEEMTKEMV